MYVSGALMQGFRAHYFSGIKLSVATDRLPATFFFNITNVDAQIEHATPSGTRGRDACVGQ